MKVAITGGGGFIGQALARAIVARGVLTGPGGAETPVDELALFDVAEPALPEAPGIAATAAEGITVTTAAGDVSDPAAVAALIDRDDVSVFHLASVVSGGGELDFDLAMRVNLTGGLNVLEACRARGGCPRLVFTSSIAVYGGAAMPEPVADATRQTPETTYGASKAITELLINDYTRKGFLDGRAARLPTVIVRPGRPNAAASSFVSGVIREPLNGEPCRLPVGLETRMPVLGHRAVIAGLIALHEADGAVFGGDRALNFPSLSVRVAEMIAALERVAAAKDYALGKITVEPDPAIERIVATWPGAMDSTRAEAIGLPKDASLDAIIEAYIEDYLEG